ncbi:recombinase family protein [Bradyrhizobium sp. Ai1a-2]|uniref:recombinase family protein n=1 Tax=Bradyrhizobium sp. Ai1a-2 TaxID=196490 RepID=UPI0003FAF3A4|nr:recombinase family protein [Bradyrhizobium sp. Ai1a-2]
MIYGYARVSTDGQSLDAQRDTLKAAGCDRIFAEKMSGARSDRPALAKALAALGPGDVLMTTKIDRLARSTRDLLNSLHEITTTGAGFRSLGDPWCDTTTPHGKLLTTVLAGFAEFERTLIVARTSEGRARAKARGQHMGRPLKLSPFQRTEALARYDTGKETLSDIARSYGCSHTTIGRLLIARQARQAAGA